MLYLETDDCIGLHVYFPDKIPDTKDTKELTF